MTHELRTPLHGILNLAEFGMTETTTEEKTALKKYIKVSSLLIKYCK